MKGTLILVLFIFCSNGYTKDVGSCISALMDFKIKYYPSLNLAKENAITLPTLKCTKSLVERCSGETGSYQLNNKISGLPYNNGVFIYTNAQEDSQGQSFFVKFPPLENKNNKNFKFSIDHKEYCGEVSKLAVEKSYNFKFVALDNCGQIPKTLSMGLQDDNSLKIASDSLKEIIESAYNDLEKDHLKDNSKTEGFSKVLETCRTRVPQHGEINDVSPIKNIINVMIEKINTKNFESSDSKNGNVSPK